MSFLDGLLNKGKAKLSEFANQHSHTGYAPPPPAQYQYQPNQYQPANQYQYQNPAQYQPQYQPQYAPSPPPGAPPINYASKPGGSAYSQGPPQPAIYWKANFNPQTPISELFEQEIGNHGWGNSESQNYTKNPRNCFFTPDNKLVLRGIVDSNSPDKYTSARLISAQSLERPKGCLTAVLTPPCASGIWPAFWLLPKKPFSWPTDGEVDIFESWNGDNINHSCLHWGHYNGEDWNKHRAVYTPIPTMGQQPHTFSFAWDDERENGGQSGRLVWYIDGNPVMKASVPQGTRLMRDYRIILNVAMGGNVCGGKLPSDGHYDLVVHELKMTEEPVGGWGRFGADWERTREGKTL